jgi:hypothetical protein
MRTSRSARRRSLQPCRSVQSAGCREALDSPRSGGCVVRRREATWIPQSSQTFTACLPGTSRKATSRRPRRAPNQLHETAMRDG